MKTNEIIKNIKGNGGFNNFHHLDKKEVAVWVKENYNCSTYVANKVAEYIK